MSIDNNVLFTAFGEQRVASPTTLFDISHEYDTHPNFWWTTGAGTAVYSAGNSFVTLNSTAVAGEYCQRQSKIRSKYQPGKSKRAVLTGSFEGWVAGHQSDMGYADDLDGVILRRRSDGKHSLILRAFGSDANEVLQDNWDNKLRNSYPSPIDFSFSKQFILDIDLQWLGVGDVRVYIAANRKRYLIHTFKHNEMLTKPYMATATLPIYYQIKNISSGAPASMKQICASVVSEGGNENVRSIKHGHPNTSAAKTCGTSWTPIMSMRCAQTFAAVPNRIPVALNDWGVLSDGACEIGLFYNAALVGATWASAVPSTSCMEIDVAAATMTSAGQILIEKQFLGSGTGTSRISGGFDTKSVWPLGRLGALFDHYTIAARALTGSVSAYAWANVLEFR